MFFPGIWIVYVTLQLLTDHVVRFGLMVVREIFVEALWTIVRIGLLDPMDTYADLEPSIAKRTVGLKGFLNIAGIICAYSL